MPPPCLMVIGQPHLSVLSGYQFVDAVEYFNPDAIIFPNARTWIQFRANHQDILNDVPDTDTIALNRRTPTESPDIFRYNNVDLVVATTDDHLASVEALEHNGTLDVTTETYILTDYLDISIDLTSLSTTLNGIEAYKGALVPDSLDGSYTHLLATASVGYRREWNGLPIYGIMPEEESSELELSSLYLSPDGTVCTAEIRASQLGLQAFDEVGPILAERLHAANYHDRMAVADADIKDLLTVEGIGQATARRLHDHATAITNGTVVCDGDRYFPRGEPIFIDIETDGLTPTIIWLIGALNRDNRANDSYMSFLQRDPDNAGGVIEVFMSWYAANATHRPIVAYNGLNFDFPIIREHIGQHCPEYLYVWDNAYTFDPYAWAVHNDNALFPGRTNQLDDVADALGWEFETSNLSGAAVARTYRRWMSDERSEAEPDWDRLETYCENDVRALAHVYDALNDARRTTSSHETTIDTPSTQGKLTDFD